MSTSTPVPNPSPTAARRDALGRYHRNLGREHGFEPLRVEGTLPADLEGTLFRNGPMVYENRGLRYQHVFDGDGGIYAVRMAGGQAQGAVRLVDTRERRRERAAGKALYGSGLTPGPQWWRRPLNRSDRNAANTNVMLWQKRLFALWEGGKPYELNTDDLATRGLRDLGVIRGTLSAHPHRVPARKAQYNFGVRYGRATKLDLFEFPDAGPARRLTSVRLPDWTAFLHDFAVTERHAVFFVPPARLRPLPMLLGLQTPLQSMRWLEDEPVQVLVIPLDDPERHVRFEVDSFYQYHVINAYEDGDTVVVELPWHERLPLQSLRLGTPGAAPPDTPDLDVRRVRIDVGRRRMTTEVLTPQELELAVVSPRVLAQRHRYAYMLGEDDARIPGKLVKLDVQTGTTETLEVGERCFCSEASFVPRRDGSDEDDGYLLSMVYDADTDRSALWVLDARDIRAKPLARVHFGQHLPFALHGLFAPLEGS